MVPPAAALRGTLTYHSYGTCTYHRCARLVAHQRAPRSSDGDHRQPWPGLRRRARPGHRGPPRAAAGRPGRRHAGALVLGDHRCRRGPPRADVAAYLLRALRRQAGLPHRAPAGRERPDRGAHRRRREPPLALAGAGAPGDRGVDRRRDRRPGRAAVLDPRRPLAGRSRPPAPATHDDGLRRPDPHPCREPRAGQRRSNPARPARDDHAAGRPQGTDRHHRRGRRRSPRHHRHRDRRGDPHPRPPRRTARPGVTSSMPGCSRTGSCGRRPPGWSRRSPSRRGRS